MIILANFVKYTELIDLETYALVQLPVSLSECKGLFNWLPNGVFSAIYVRDGAMYLRYENEDIEIDDKMYCESEVLTPSLGRFSLFDINGDADCADSRVLRISFEFPIDAVLYLDMFRDYSDDSLLWGELIKSWISPANRLRIIREHA